MAPLVCERLHLDDAHRGRSAWGTATSTGQSPLAAGARDRGVVVGDEIRISADIAAGTERRDA